MVMIPERTTRAVAREFGEAGKEWLEQLPGRLAELGRQWQLSFEEPFDNGLPINIVFRVTRGNQLLILKTGFPHPEMLTEMAVLAHWRNRPGCVQLVDSDEKAGAVLMERVIPGASVRILAQTQSEYSVSSQVRQLIEKTPLRVSDSDNFPTYRHWCSLAFAKCNQNRDARALWVHMTRVETILAKAAKRYESGWLLHGDLHHDNILLHESRDYIVVDPKGVIGPRLFEYGRFVHNFFEDRRHSMSMESILTQRIAALQGEYSSDEILMVGYVDLVLASCWSVNGGQKLKTETLELIELMSVLLKA